MVAVPSLSTTVPVGIPELGATGGTLTVNVIGWPNPAVPEEAYCRSIRGRPTAWENGREVLGLKLPSPP